MKQNFSWMMAGIILCLIVVVGSAAAWREKFFQRFEPKMVEAITLTCLDEFNRNRAWHGQTLLSTQQMVQAVSTKLDSMEDYASQTNRDWML